MSIARRVFIPAAIVMQLVPGALRAQTEMPPGPYPELMRTYYDYGVVEYCGLVDLATHNGFALLRADQLARLRVGMEGDRRTRIDAAKLVEYEFQDHGLSGTKAWCRTEGRDAVERFTTYFRLRRLP
ncbi:MAG: hypothetical protein HYU58_18260 [Proteobacteria bacterium]|nr:hypothetical protein [Pseudomonadota bacterium]